MKEYLFCLFKQYCEAKGINPNNYNETNKEGFQEWINQNAILLKNYFDYLIEEGYPYSDEDVVEIGKGKYDSLSKYGMSIVSPYASTLGQSNSSLYIYEGIPYILKPNGLALPSEHTILTHNPYSIEKLADWCRVHNNGDMKISIGMFGKKDDEDEAKKIDILSRLTRELDDGYSFMIDTYDDNYICSINSDRHIKKKIKTF